MKNILFGAVMLMGTFAFGNYEFIEYKLIDLEEDFILKGCPLVRIDYTCCYEYVEMCGEFPSGELLMFMDEIYCGDDAGNNN